MTCKEFRHYNRSVQSLKSLTTAEMAGCAKHHRSCKSCRAWGSKQILSLTDDEGHTLADDVAARLCADPEAMDTLYPE